MCRYIESYNKCSKKAAIIAGDFNAQFGPGIGAERLQCWTTHAQRVEQTRRSVKKQRLMDPRLRGAQHDVQRRTRPTSHLQSGRAGETNIWKSSWLTEADDTAQTPRQMTQSTWEASTGPLRTSDAQAQGRATLLNLEERAELVLEGVLVALHHAGNTQESAESIPPLEERYMELETKRLTKNATKDDDSKEIPHHCDSKSGSRYEVKCRLQLSRISTNGEGRRHV